MSALPGVVKFISVKYWEFPSRCAQVLVSLNKLERITKITDNAFCIISGYRSYFLTVRLGPLLRSDKATC